MSTCKTCKWWQHGDNKYYYPEIISPTDPDTWESMPLTFEVNFCKSPLLGFYERPVVSNGACVVDGSRYMAALITAPDFGCVNWETAKE